MGRDKALLELGGISLAVRSATLLKPLCSEVFLVAGSADAYHRLGFPVLIDEFPGEGPLGALITVLGFAYAPWNLVLSCDLAMAEPGPLEALADLALGSDGGARALVPQADSKPQPMHAAYHTDLLPSLRPLWTAGERGLIRALSKVPAVRPVLAAEIGAGPNQFVNVNTPEEWLAVRGGEKV